MHFINLSDYLAASVQMKPVEINYDITITVQRYYGRNGTLSYSPVHTERVACDVLMRVDATTAPYYLTLVSARRRATTLPKIDATLCDATRRARCERGLIILGLI